MLVNIETKKPKAKRTLGPAPLPPTKKQALNNRFQKAKPLTSSDIDTLADITNGKCGLVILMQKPDPILSHPPNEPPVEIITIDVERLPQIYQKQLKKL